MSTLYVDNLEPNLGSRVMAAGHVVQVVHNTINQKIAFTSTSFTSSGLSVSITPTSANSKIHVRLTTGGAYWAGQSVLGLVFHRSSDNTYSPIGTGGAGNMNAPDGMTMGMYSADGSGNNNLYPITVEWFDTTHNTTSPITYSVYGANNNGTYSTYMGGMGDNTVYQVMSTLSVTEIAQ